MTALGPFSSRRDRGSRRYRAVVWALRLLALGVAFALGVALGRALEENSGSGGRRTYVGTLRPLTLPPGTTITVIAPTG